MLDAMIPVDVWMSYNGGFTDLAAGSRWAEPIPHCGRVNPYTAWADDIRGGASSLLLAADEPGKEILHPVAVVIFGGLISSTLLDTLLTPLLFWAYGESATARLLSSDGSDGAAEAPSPAGQNSAF